MFKGRLAKPGQRDSLILGFAEDDLTQLICNRSIAFKLADIGFTLRDTHAQLCAIMYVPTNRIISPLTGLSVPDDAVLYLTLNDESIATMQAGDTLNTSSPGFNLDVELWSAATSQDVIAIARRNGLFNENTVIHAEGFTPTDKPIYPN